MQLYFQRGKGRLSQKRNAIPFSQKCVPPFNISALLNEHSGVSHGFVTAGPIRSSGIVTLGEPLCTRDAGTPAHATDSSSSLSSW